MNCVLHCDVPLPNIVCFFAHVVEKFEIIKQKAVTFNLLAAVTVKNNDVWVVTASDLVEIFVPSKRKLRFGLRET